MVRTPLVVISLEIDSQSVVTAWYNARHSLEVFSFLKENHIHWHPSCYNNIIFFLIKIIYLLKPVIHGQERYQNTP